MENSTLETYPTFQSFTLCKYLHKNNLKKMLKYSYKKIGMLQNIQPIFTSMHASIVYVILPYAYRTWVPGFRSILIQQRECFDLLPVPETMLAEVSHFLCTPFSGILKRDTYENYLRTMQPVNLNFMVKLTLCENNYCDT